MDLCLMKAVLTTYSSSPNTHTLADIRDVLLALGKLLLLLPHFITLVVILIVKLLPRWEWLQQTPRQGGSTDKQYKELISRGPEVFAV